MESRNTDDRASSTQALALPDARRWADVLASAISVAGADAVAVVGDTARGACVVRAVEILIRGLSASGISRAVQGDPSSAGDRAPAEMWRLVVAADRTEAKIDRVPPAFGWAAARVLYTADESHRAWLLSRACERGIAIFDFGSDEAFYTALDWPFVPPELREGAAARAHPDLITPSDVRGLVHVHTTFSDGKNDLEANVLAAVEGGYSYLGISDHFGPHSRSITIDALETQRRELRELARRYPNIVLFHGLEIDILDSGDLAADRAILAGLDFVIASIHNPPRDGASGLGRLLRAVEDPFVSIVGHPTGRILPARESADVDGTRLGAACRERGVVLEINGMPYRLDPPDHVLDAAAREGTAFVVTPDAHRIEDHSDVRYAIERARRANLPRDRVLSTRTATELSAYFRERRERAGVPGGAAWH